MPSPKELPERLEMLAVLVPVIGLVLSLAYYSSSKLQQQTREL